MSKPIGEQTVHVLHHGSALCGVAGLPGGWPDGHVWVQVDLWKWATCGECRGKAEQLETNRQED